MRSLRQNLLFSAALMASGGVFAQSAIAPNALPTGGHVAAGAATISQSGNTLNVVQASQRAVVNWNSFNVGSQAKVEFIQPNAQAVIHNRVISASASQIDVMIKANGQVIISNASGVVFGKSAQIDVGAIVATTMDINDRDFMEGKNTFKGNGKGAVINQGKIQTNDPKGYIALLAPEVRNEGYILAKGGAANVVALASGSQVTLDFRGDQLMTVKVDASVYKSLIENKRVVQVDGGMVVIAANSAAQLMGSVIKNSGRISTSSMVNNGGVIEILADNVQNSGAIMANAKGSTGNGGQINIKGNTIALADTSKIKANAKEQGNGGQIIVLSEKKTQVSGVLEAKGGKTSGNGGFIDTSSKEVLEISSQTKVDTSARNSLGNAGTWLLDPMDLLITSSFAQVISDALQNNNVTVQVQGNVCSGGSCTQNGSGNLTIDQGVTITKSGGVKTVLTFLADGTFYNYGVINQAADSILEVVIQAQNVNLAQNSKIEVNKVTITAVNSVTGYGSIIGAGANPLVNILANIFNFHGAITVNSRAQVTVNGVTSNSATVGTIRITAEELTLASTGKLEVNGDINGGAIILNANGTGIITVEGLIQTNGGNGRGGEINISQADDIHINNAIIQSDGNNGGYINIFTNSGDLILQNALIQTNGSNGRGGSIGISATNNTLVRDSNIEAKGLNQGGIILIGNDADNGTLPFSISVTLDNANIDVSATNNLNNQDINQIKIDAQNDLLINNSSSKANGEQGGQIYLNSQYQDIVFNNSVIQTNGSNGRGGTVEISSNSGNLTINSTIQATGATVGGTVLLTADHILLDSNTNIDITGKSGGGSVLVGGDWQGGSNQDLRVFPNRDIHQSMTVFMNSGALIDASAIQNGNGGIVVLWSDITKHNSITSAQGTIYSKGGSQGGLGGKVETSGAFLLFNQIVVDTKAYDGLAGDWLLDPGNIEITTNTSVSSIAGPTYEAGGSGGWTLIHPDAINNALNNSNLTITTGSGSNYDIVNNALIRYTGSSERTLTLKATAAISTGTIESINAKLNVVIWVEADGGPSRGPALGTITTNGGHVWVGGGSGTRTWNGLTVGNGLAMSDGTANHYAIDLYGNISTAGGDIYLGGSDGYLSAPSIGAIGANRTLNAGSGNISLIVRDASSLNGGSNIVIQTTGRFTVAPPSGENWVSDITWGALSNPISGVTVNNPSSLGGLSIGTYDGTGREGDTAYVSSNHRTITISNAISTSGSIKIQGGEISLAAALTTSSTLSTITINVGAGQYLKTVTNTNASILTAPGGITINSDNFAWSAGNPTLSTSGVVTIQPVSTSFGHGTNTTWFTLSGSLSGFNYGKPGSTSGIDVGSITISGPVNIYGGIVNLHNNINTSGGNGLINIIGSTVIDPITAISLSSGSGNITLTTPYIDRSTAANTITINSTGHFTYQPFGSGFNNDVGGQLDLSGSLISNKFTGSADASWLIVNNVSSLGGLTIGKLGNTSSIHTYTPWSINGPINFFGNNITIQGGALTADGAVSLIGNSIFINDSNLIVNGSGQSILLKATYEMVIGLGGTTLLQANNGNITLWADSDGNGEGPIRIRENVTFNSANGSTSQSSSGGAITLAGGSSTDALTGLPNGYAHAQSALTSNWGNSWISRIQLGAYTSNYGSGMTNNIGFYSGGGNVVIKGKSSNGMPGVTWMGGISGGTQIINAGNGTITIDGQGVGNGHGIEFTYGGGVTGPDIRSSNTTSGAINISGATTSTSLHAGFQGRANVRATGSGGGITLSGTTSASAYRSIEAGGLNLYSLSGPIFINGTGGTGVAIGGNWGKGDLASSTSNITVTSPSGIHLVSTTIDTSGNVKFDGALTLYSDQIINSAGVVTFTGTINSDATATPRSLTVNAGTGSIVFGAAVGGVNPLRSATASGAAGISINGNITTVTGLADGLLFEAFDGFIGDNLSAFTTAIRQNVKTTEVAGASGSTNTATSTTVNVCTTGNLCDDTYSYRVTGYFVPRFSGTYTFQVNGDDNHWVFLGNANQTIADLTTQVQLNGVTSLTPGYVVGKSACCSDTTGSRSGLVAGQIYPIYAAFSENQCARCTLQNNS